MTGTVHIVGAGLAGLAAGVALSGSGRRVALHEAAAQAGGRCRSFHDRTLDAVIDNGNHLMLSCNRAALDYLARIGAGDRVATAASATFPFMDLDTGERWRIAIGDGRLPRWIFRRSARVPGTRWTDYPGVLRLVMAGSRHTVADRLETASPVYRRLWEPLAVAILNTAPAEGAARLLAGVFREAFARGGATCRPVIATHGLSAAFVDPALAFIAAHGGTIGYGRRLLRLEIADRVRALHFGDAAIALGSADSVILALPAPAIRSLLPDMPAPRTFRSIVNAHFRVDVPRTPEGFVGLIGGHAEWIFEKDGIVATTTSAAERLIDLAPDALARLLWHDVARAYDLDPQTIPPCRIVKERRATFAATPAETARRPPVARQHGNLIVCGDWTDTGLPGSIEGAIRSGNMAAAVCGAGSAALPPSAPAATIVRPAARQP